MPDFYKGAIVLGKAQGAEYQFLLSPYGRKLKIADVQLSREERTASGKLVRDIIAVKKKFTLSYSEIDGVDLDNLLIIYAYDSELVLRIYTDDDFSEDYTVMMDPLERERLLLSGPSDSGLWSNVTVTLNEV